MDAKVEPKTFFANERTFLQWVTVGVFIGGIGIGIDNEDDRKFNVSGTMFA